MINIYISKMIYIFFIFRHVLQESLKTHGRCSQARESSGGTSVNGSSPVLIKNQLYCEEIVEVHA